MGLKIFLKILGVIIMVFLIGKLNAWDASATDSLTCKGFSGVGSDGEYNYYTPYHNGSVYHGIVLRQKIFGVFKDASSWEAYDAGSVDGLTTKGYFGNPIFDGQFMYFTPNNNGSVSGIVLRYDTTKPFKSSTSWEAYNAGYVDSLTTKGFRGAVFAGQFIYFVPYHNGAYNGIVLRYDTTKPFKSSTSWEAYDLGGMAGGAAKGYWGAAVLENFIYFSPYQNAASTYHGQILRYDMSKPFKSAGAWTVFNAATVSANCKGLGAPCTDGQFVYFPNAVYGLILRYDSTLPFTDSGSYATFDIANLSENTESHNSCCVQGHYVAFSPSRYTILVYDTEKPFTDPGSWTEKEVAGADNSGIWGYLGSYSDLNYVYFAPYQQYVGSASSVHGTVLRGRIDPCPSQEFPGPGEENFSEYMLDDVGDYLSVSSGRVSAVGMEPDMVALLYQDYGKDCFDGFEILFDLRISSIVTYSDYGDYGEICTLSLSNRHSSYDPSLTDANDPCICLVAEFAADRSLDGLYLYLNKLYTAGSGYAISTGTTYYCKLTRPDGNGTVTLRIYSNSARTTLLATLTESGFPTTLKWRYLYAMRGSDSGEWQASYYLENLNVISY